MTPTAIVLASVALGLFAGALITTTVFLARAAGRRRAAAVRPELPSAVAELVDALDGFAVILDASLSPIYANAAAREETKVTGEELRDPEFLTRARRVMSSGIPDTRMPDPETPGDTVRTRIVRLQRRFLVVLVDDLGEEQRVNAMRRDFIANVSHELKTPIAAIGLLSEAVTEAADDPAIVRNFAGRLRKESKRLADLSRDIIQLSEAQSGLTNEDHEPVSIAALVRTETEAHQEFATQQHVELVFTEPSVAAADALTLGRPAPLGAAIANLLSNAIRHSPPGGRVGVGMELTGSNCIVTITDQGEGIEAEHLPRIFERFYRVDAARSREGGGTGLGLSIARHTMRSHGGDIEVWSQPGVGSSFSLVFAVLDQDRRSAGRKPAKKTKKTKGSKKSKESKEPKGSRASKGSKKPKGSKEPKESNDAVETGKVEKATKSTKSAKTQKASKVQKAETSHESVSAKEATK